MSLLHRRELLALAGSAALVGSVPALAQTPGRKIRVTQAVTSLAYIQSFVARERGYFKDEGLAVELVDTGGGGPDVQLVLGGRAEMTVNDGAQVLPALQQGQQLRCVMSLLNRSIVNATMRKDVAERLGITASTPVAEKLGKMKGLKIGVTRPGALTWQQARFNLVSAGLNPDRDADLIGVGGAPALAAALEFGKVDVIYISMPVGERLVQEGKAVGFIDNARGEDPKLPRFMMEGLWATPDYIAANRDVVQAAVRAYRKASDTIVSEDERSVVASLIPSLGSLGEAVLLDAVRRMKPAVSRTGIVDAAEFETTEGLLRSNGILKDKIEFGSVFDRSFVAI